MTKPKAGVRPAGDKTRTRILSAAEALFAEHGYDGVSMRQVGAEAEVPFALVTYHFETKAGLYRAIFVRRSEAMAAAWRAPLQAIALSGRPRDDLAQAAQALVQAAAAIRGLEDGEALGRLIARELNDCQQGARGVVEIHFDPLAQAVTELLTRAAPSADRTRVLWAYRFALGAVTAALSGADVAGRAAGDSPAVFDAAAADELGRFIAAGLAGVLSPAD